MPRDGTFAGYVAVPASQRVSQAGGALDGGGRRDSARRPDGVSRALHARRAAARARRCSITGVGGGVQTFVLLFAKRAGARAIVTSSSDEKLARAKELGADVTINYATSPDWAKTLRAAEQVDLVVDSSGGDTLRAAIDVVRPGGRDRDLRRHERRCDDQDVPALLETRDDSRYVDGKPAGLRRQCSALRDGDLRPGDRPRRSRSTTSTGRVRAARRIEPVRQDRPHHVTLSSAVVEGRKRMLGCREHVVYRSKRSL